MNKLKSQPPRSRISSLQAKQKVEPRSRASTISVHYGAGGARRRISEIIYERVLKANQN